MNKSKPEYVIYTDASRSNEYPVAVAAALIYDMKKKTLKECIVRQVKYRQGIHYAEVKAIVLALDSIKEPSSILVFTDQEELCNAVTDRKTLIKKINGRYSKIYLQLIKAAKKHYVVMRHVKSHSGNIFNNECDHLAKQEMQRIIKTKYNKYWR